MAALLALGGMSIGWMLLVAALIAFEKLLPWEVLPKRATAAVLLVLGAAVMLFPDQVPGLTIPMDGMSSMDAMSM
jgi:predicted metal-binding membrane protein